MQHTCKYLSLKDKVEYVQYQLIILLRDPMIGGHFRYLTLRKVPTYGPTPSGQSE